MKPGDVPAAVFGDINVVTNCDYVDLFKNDEFVKRFYPNRKTFKYLKHPPIVIDDLIGETFKETKFPPKARKRMAKMLSYAAIYGYGNITLPIKIYLAYAMMRYKITFPELVGYWNEYVGSWGGKAKTYKLKGYINNKLVKEAEIGPSNEFDLSIDINKEELKNEDTYDTLRIRLNHIDNHGNTAQYSTRIVNVEVSGPINLVGPSTQALNGGQLTLYFTSKQEKGLGKIKITMDNIVKEISIPVK